MVPFHRRLLVACILALGAMLAPTGRADSNKAVQEFREGRALVILGKCDEAIPHFRASLAIAVAVGPLMNLGECLAKLGKLASAARAFEQAAELARDTGDPEREAESQRMRASLKPSTLTIRSASGNARVLVDSEPQALGAIVAVDGGEHSLVFETGSERQSQTITIAPSGEAQVIDVPEAAPAPVEALPEKALRPAPPHRKLRAYVAGGAGALGLTIGTILGITVLNSRSELDALCPSYPACPAGVRDRVTDLNDSANSRATIATVALTAGAVLAATAVVLYVLDVKR